MRAGCLLLLAAMFVTTLYDADDNKWFLHKRNVLILVPHDWPVDDAKLCVLDGDVGTPALTCGDYSAIPRKMTLHLRGPLSPRTSWDCEKVGELISREAKTWHW
jgi:hypothetical protein